MARKKLDLMGLPKNPGGSILSVFVSLPKQYIAMRQQVTLSIAKGLSAPFKRAGSWKRAKGRRIKAKLPWVRAKKSWRRKRRRAIKKIDARWQNRQQAATPAARGPGSPATKRAAAPPSKPTRPVHRPVEDQRRTARRPATPAKRKKDNRECAWCGHPANDQDGELYAYDNGWYHDQGGERSCMQEHITASHEARRRKHGPFAPPGPRSPQHQKVGMTRR